MKTADAITLFGSRSEIARLLGIKKQSVQLWGEEVPDLRQFQLYELQAFMQKPGPPILEVDPRLRPWLKT